jgi:hypothetical protein
MKSVGSLLDRPKPGKSTATSLKAITYESFWHKSGYELFVAMHSFTETLPEPQP